MMSVAEQLSRHLAPRSTVLILLPFGRRFVMTFLGSLACNVVPIPMPLPYSSGERRRLDSVAAKVNPNAIVTIKDEFESLQIGAKRSIGLTLDENSELQIAIRDSGDPDPKDVFEAAYIQYTSGSMSSPKGVMISHKNIVSNLQSIHESFGHQVSDVLVSWLPMYHDMGLIYGVLGPLHGGFTGILFSPSLFLRNPLVWLEIIARYRATHSGSPNFGYDHLIGTLTFRLGRLPSTAQNSLEHRHWTSFRSHSQVSDSTRLPFARPMAWPRQP